MSGHIASAARYCKRERRKLGMTQRQCIGWYFRNVYRKEGAKVRRVKRSGRRSTARKACA